MEKVGLIAGYGKLPLLWIKKANKKDVRVHAFLINEEYSANIAGYAYTADYLNLTQLDRLIKKMKNYNLDKIIMLGKVDKKHLFKKNNFDQRFNLLFLKLQDLEDHTILAKIVEEFNKENLEVLDQRIFMDDFLVNSGQINNIEPDQQLKKEMQYAYQKAKEIANLNIGQTILTKDKAVVAVEALEGTDLTIKRAGSLVKKGTVMAKVSKDRHDFRFDIPTIGLDTIRNLIFINAKGLVLESKKILIINQREIIKLADRANLSIISISPEEV